MFKRINIDPKICHGKPVIKGTRILVSNILAELADGRSYKEIIQNYPNLKEEDIIEALNFGSYILNYETHSYDTQTS